jgi:hypothetical protein
MSGLINTAQQLNSSTACCLLSGLIVTALVGCGEFASAISTGENSIPVQSAEAIPRVPVVQGGIVFSDRDGYFCVPLEQIGLAASEQIASIASSCDCLVPAVVTYRSTSGFPQQAVLLTYKNSLRENADVESNAKHAPVNLGVMVDLTTTRGSTHQFTVNLLHTSLLQESVP